MNVIIYIRVSTKKQVGDDAISLDMQRRICEEWCRSQGYFLFQIFQEIGSAYQGRRMQPMLSRAITTLSQMPGERMIVVAFADRFSRNVSHFTELMRKMCRRNINLVVVNHQERTLYSNNGNDGDTIYRAIKNGENESRQRGVKARQVYNYLNANSLPGLPYHIGAAPYGKKRVRVETPTHNYWSLETNEEELALKKRIALRVFKDFGRGINENDVFESVSYELNREGLTFRGFQWTPKNIQRLYYDYLNSICCEKCGDDGDHDLMLCENCMKGMHTRCTRNVRGDYYCDDCAPEQSFVRTRGQRNKDVRGATRTYKQRNEDVEKIDEPIGGSGSRPLNPLQIAIRELEMAYAAPNQSSKERQKYKKAIEKLELMDIDIWIDDDEDTD